MKLFEKTYVYEQDADTCQFNSQDGQVLTIQTQDGGGGNYLVISTDRWAIDKNDIDKFCNVLKDMIKDME